MYEIGELKLEGQACWELVGECYVHGLMDGEAVGEKWGHVSQEDIFFAWQASQFIR